MNANTQFMYVHGRLPLKLQSGEAVFKGNNTGRVIEPCCDRKSHQGDLKKCFGAKEGAAQRLGACFLLVTFLFDGKRKVTRQEAK